MSSKDLKILFESGQRRIVGLGIKDYGSASIRRLVFFVIVRSRHGPKNGVHFRLPSTPFAFWRADTYRQSLRFTG